MIYLTLDDLKTDSFERFIRESAADFDNALDRAERRAIGLIKPYLRDRYDVEAIFDKKAPLREEMLIDILSALTLFKIHGRNAARKFSSDDVEGAMKQLDKIATGKITLALPPPKDESGNPDSQSLWGSLRNDDFYI
ncbi:MAG: phage protein Gp36 family protein [Flavobacteriales bacterium]